MKKTLRIISVFLIVTIFCISTPFVLTDISALGSEKQHKISIDEFSLITHHFAFDNNQNKPTFKPHLTALLGIFNVPISKLYSLIIIQSDTSITIDFRKKIRKLLANHYHGSKYTKNSLFI